MSIPKFQLKAYLPIINVYLSINETLVSVQDIFETLVVEIPFYVSDGFLYFNVSRANEIGMEDMYHVVIAANGTELGMVGMVLTTVSVERGGCSPLCL